MERIQIKQNCLVRIVRDHLIGLQKGEIHTPPNGYHQWQVHVIYKNSCYVFTWVGTFPMSHCHKNLEN